MATGAARNEGRERRGKGTLGVRKQLKKHDDGKETVTWYGRTSRKWGVPWEQRENGASFKDN